MDIVGPVMTPDAAPPGNHGDGTELGGLSLFLDLERYPLTDLGGATGQAVVDAARAQLAATGAAELTGVVNAAGIRALVDEAEELAPRAHHSGGEGTAYLEFPDFDLPKDHPRLRFAPYGVAPWATTSSPGHRCCAASTRATPFSASSPSSSTADRSTATEIRSVPSTCR